MTVQLIRSECPKPDETAYVVVRLNERGDREYLYAVTPALWDSRRRLALRFNSAEEADQRTRGLGEWRFIMEVDSGRF
jgi:hypothetical protein